MGEPRRATASRLGDKMINIHHPILTSILLGLAVFLAIVCAIGMAIMRDPYQRLQFMTPVVGVSMPLIVIAVWLENADWQARIKVILVSLILFVMNAILSHATARAIRIRALGRWDVKPEEKIPIAGREGETVK